MIQYAKYLGQEKHEPIDAYCALPRETLYTQILGSIYNENSGVHRQLGANLFQEFIEPMKSWRLEGTRIIENQFGHLTYQRVYDEYGLGLELYQQALYTLEQRAAGLADDNTPRQGLGYRRASEGQARKFYIRTIVTILENSFEELLASHFFPQMMQRFIQTVASKGAVINHRSYLDPEDFKYMSRLPQVVQQAARILQSSTYRLDWQRFCSRDFLSALRTQKLSLSQKLWLLDSLSGLGLQREVQYHPTVILQRPGRLGTRGGVIGLPKWIRHRLVRPAEDDHVLVEMDLCCAQLLLAAKTLELNALVEQILSLLDEGETKSIWPHISPQDLDKRAKKVVVYGLVFGAELKNLWRLANQATTTKITKAITNTILNCDLLKPLVQAREVFLERITDEVLRGNAQYQNQLGLRLNGDKYLEEAMAEVNQREQSRKRKRTTAARRKDAARRVARQVAAHHMQ